MSLNIEDEQLEGIAQLSDYADNFAGWSTEPFADRRDIKKAFLCIRDSLRELFYQIASQDPERNPYPWVDWEKGK